MEKHLFYWSAVSWWIEYDFTVHLIKSNFKIYQSSHYLVKINMYNCINMYTNCTAILFSVALLTPKSYNIRPFLTGLFRNIHRSLPYSSADTSDPFVVSLRWIIIKVYSIALTGQAANVNIFINYVISILY